jgi:hypothetical protein
VELQGSDGTRTRSTSETSIEFADLVNGAAYRLRVAASNSAGPGDFSEWSRDLVPIGPASAPTTFIGRSGDRSVSLEWSASDDSGGAPIEMYVVQWEVNGSAVAVATQTRALSIDALTNGQSYSFRVAAQTSYGPGEWSRPITLTPRAEPVTEPLEVTLTNKKRRVYVRWQESAVGESTRYVVQVSINDKRFRFKKSSTNLRTQFTIGKRTKTVAVRIAYGRGPWSEPVELILKP